MWLSARSRALRYQLYLLKRHILRRSEGESVLRGTYRELYGKALDIENPTSFSEKLFTRMIRINRGKYPLYTRLADKYLVRDYVKAQIGEQYLVQLIWQGKDPRKIPFDDLPAKCIVKANHASGRTMVLDSSANRAEVLRRLQEWMAVNHYWVGREYQYYGIPRRILVESFLDDGNEDGPLDYRFWCFHGRPELIQVDNHAHGINPFYDVEWNPLPVRYRENFKECEIEEPPNLSEMLQVAAQLSSDFDFVRVDLYNLQGRICFGELTFTPAAGGARFKPESWDMVLGRKWHWTS